MANKKSAEKRHRQSIERRMRNRKAKSEIRTVVRRFTSLVGSKKKDEAEKEFDSVKKFLDTACQRGILHKNTVARKKSRLAKKLNSLA